MPVQLFRPEESGSSVPTVRSIVDAYVANLRLRAESNEYSADAVAGAKRELDRFAGVYGTLTMDRCRRHDVSEWLTSNPQWKSNHTRKRVVTTILSCFNWAEEEELIERSPYRRLRSLKMATEPRREATQAEYVRLMRSRSKPLRRALFFLRRTGCRTCEMRNLTWPDVDFDAAVVDQSKHKTRRYTGQSRVYGLEPCVLRFLRNLHSRRRHDEDHVFTNCHGTPWDRHSFARHLRRWAKRLGIDDGVEKRVSAYCIRHAYITAAIEAGVGERQIADQTGHKDTRMIAWYSKAAKKRKYLKDVAGSAVRRPKGGDGPNSTGVTDRK